MHPPQQYPAAGPTPRRRRVLLVALLIGIAAACSGSGDDEATATTLTEGPVSEATTPSTAATSTTTDASQEPAPPGCPDVDAVAALVGAGVDVTATGGGRGSTSGVSFSYEGCSYGLTDGDGELGIVRVEVEGEELAYDVLNEEARLAAEADGFEPVEGLGDEAWLDGTAYAVRRGPSMFFAELIPAPTDGAGVAGSLSAILAEAVVPLDLTTAPAELCGAVEDAVAEALGPVDSVSQSQGGVAVNEVSFATSGCDLVLTNGAEAIIDVASGEEWDAWVAAKEASSFTRSYEGLTIGQLSAYDTGEELVVDDGDDPLRITTEDLDLDLDPDETAQLRLDLAELALG
ncbi:hypothetical protein BH23ACT2_BH23ACT2_18570 [soil metagenome]